MSPEFLFEESQVQNSDPDHFGAFCFSDVVSRQQSSLSFTFRAEGLTNCINGQNTSISIVLREAI